MYSGHTSVIDTPPPPPKMESTSPKGTEFSTLLNNLICVNGAQVPLYGTRRDIRKGCTDKGIAFCPH